LLLLLLQGRFSSDNTTVTEDQSSSEKTSSCCASSPSRFVSSLVQLKEENYCMKCNAMQCNALQCSSRREEEENKAYEYESKDAQLLRQQRQQTLFRPSRSSGDFHSYKKDL
jgi:hypothetical protein